MEFEPRARLAGFAVVDVRDPAELDRQSSVSARLAGRNTCHRYVLRDRALQAPAPRTVLSRYATRQVGDLQLSHAGDRFGTEIGIDGDGMGAVCFGWLWGGRMALSIPEQSGQVELEPGTGPIHSGGAGTRIFTADGTTRTNVWIASRRFATALQAILGAAPREALVFAPRIDWTVGAGTSLRRMLAHLTGEFAHERNCLADNELAMTSFIDLFVHTALVGLPHNYADRLLASRDGPVPLHLRRAEAYVLAHADRPMRLEDLATEAGCSVRTLQRAFRQFRGTTAHAAIRAARLTRAREELGGGTVGVAAIAHRYGFSHLGRFAAAYARQFRGETPSQTVKRRVPEE